MTKIPTTHDPESWSIPFTSEVADEHSLRCSSCQLPWEDDWGNHVRKGPMLTAEIWAKLNNYEHEFLCWSCLETRARERLGRGLCFNDLRPAPCNVGGYGEYDTFYWPDDHKIPAEWETLMEFASYNRQGGLLYDEWDWDEWDKIDAPNGRTRIAQEAAK